MADVNAKDVEANKQAQQADKAQNDANHTQNAETNVN